MNEPNLFSAFSIIMLLSCWTKQQSIIKKKLVQQSVTQSVTIPWWWYRGQVEWFTFSFPAFFYSVLLNLCRVQHSTKMNQMERLEWIMELLSFHSLVGDWRKIWRGGKNILDFCLAQNKLNNIDDRKIIGAWNLSRYFTTGMKTNKRGKWANPTCFFLTIISSTWLLNFMGDERRWQNKSLLDLFPSTLSIICIEEVKNVKRINTFKNEAPEDHDDDEASATNYVGNNAIFSVTNRAHTHILPTHNWAMN